MANKKISCGGFLIDEDSFGFENGILSVKGGAVGPAGPQGPAGQAATIQIGSVTSGDAPAVTNSGTETDAVLDFVLQQGPAGPSKQGVAVPNVSGSEAADAIATINALLASLRDAGLIANN